MLTFLVDLEPASSAQLLVRNAFPQNHLGMLAGAFSRAAGVVVSDIVAPRGQGLEEKSYVQPSHQTSPTGSRSSVGTLLFMDLILPGSPALQLTLAIISLTL